MNLKNTPRYRLKFALIPSLATLCLLPLLLSLGMWQWHRADEKRALLQAQAQRLTSPVIALSDVPENPLPSLRYQPLTVEGHYDTAHAFLLDNQISAGKAGYFVLTPFIPQNGGTAVLVNRGWLIADANRAVLPKLALEARPRVISGRLNAFPSVGITIHGADIPSDAWPSVVQVANSTQLAKKLGYPLLPFQIELNATSTDGFKRDWQITTLLLPEQHIAYALQWFVLALTLTVLFLWSSFKKSND